MESFERRCFFEWDFVSSFHNRIGPFVTSGQLGQSGPTILLWESAIEDRAVEVVHQNFF